MRVRLLESIVGLAAALLVATIGDAWAQPAASGSGAAGADAAAVHWPDIVNNVMGRPSGRRVAGPRGASGPAGPPGPPGPAGSSTVQVVAVCASGAAGQPPAGGNPAFGPIVAALIAGFFGLLGLVIAKENKTSEFRQAWIDALRSDIADFSAAGLSFVYFEGARRDERDEARGLEYEKLLKDIHQKLAQALMMIRLRINARESKVQTSECNQALLAHVDAIAESVNKEDLKSTGELLKVMHAQAAPVLKFEWERIKRGERTYVAALYGVGLLIVVAMIVLGWIALWGP